MNEVLRVRSGISVIRGRSKEKGMLRTPDDIARRIAEAYQPESIILYGSQARGLQETASDIDILIVKETNERPLDRRIQVERLLSDRMVPLDIMVFTPEELGYLFSIGSPFIEEVMREGRVLYMRRVTESWLKDAQDELDSATILFENKKYRGACYHSQQCTEKGLKALILEKGMKPERTHDIIELLNKSTELGWNLSISMDDAILLNSIYKGRYPTEEGLLPYGEPSREDAERTVSAAQCVIEAINGLFRK